MNDINFFNVEVPLQDPPLPFPVAEIALPLGPFLLFNEDYEIVAHSSVITVMRMDSDDDPFFEQSDTGYSYYGPPLDISDAETLEDFDMAVRNNQRMLALLDRPGVEGDYRDDTIRNAKEQLERAPARRAELVQELEDEEEEEERQDQCSGTAMGNGILHITNSYCQKHGSF